MRIISLFMLLAASLTVQAQSFEGKITYRNSYKSKVAQVSDEQVWANARNRARVFYQWS